MGPISVSATQWPLFSGLTSIVHVDDMLVCIHANNKSADAMINLDFLIMVIDDFSLKRHLLLTKSR
ncbi:MAG: hypothetical protein Roseis2KO_40460 [Roseivirga sp.]